MLLGGQDHPSREVRRRIRVLNIYGRPVTSENFEVISSATLLGKRLKITHYNRARDEETEREISPQRLTYYRDNWYLEAWCHLRDGVRSFGMESIRAAVPLEKSRKPVADKILDEVLGAGYGIFGGRASETARLRFSPERARWVACERWHAKQKGWFDKDGFFVLEIPYSDDRELIMDILRHGPEVTVEAPPSLIRGVKEALERTVQRYA